jgi:hypothetical protein
MKEDNIDMPSPSIGNPVSPQTFSLRDCESGSPLLQQHRMMPARAPLTNFARPSTCPQVHAPMSSPLVAALTPAEKEALHKFKTEYLEKALQEASLSDSEVEIWGVSMNCDDARRDVVIVKFLRAK